MLEHHPDRADPGRRQTAEATTAALTAAYRVLADPLARQRYDVEAGIPRRGDVGVRRAPRPWAGDPRPVRRHHHDPVLRRVPADPGRRRHAPPADTVPLAATRPRLLAAAATALVGLALRVVGAASGTAAVQVVGAATAAVAVVAALLGELARRDGA